jgi:DNA-binding response OmpR family regulator
VSYKILIVEDEIITVDYLESILEASGYTIFGIALCGEDALSQITPENIPDLVLMDISLGGVIDGIETALHIKKRFDCPIIFLTALSDKEILERAKVAEPHGYIVKPFDQKKLVAAIEMAIYKHQSEMIKASEASCSTQQIQLLENRIKQLTGENDKPFVHINDEYVFEMHTMRLLKNGIEVKLSCNEQKFLYILIRNSNTTISNEQIENTIWPDEAVVDTTLRTLIWRLRNKLEGDFIHNITGVGYKIVTQ